MRAAAELYRMAKVITETENNAIIAKELKRIAQSGDRPGLVVAEVQAASPGDIPPPTKKRKRGPLSRAGLGNPSAFQSRTVPGDLPRGICRSEDALVAVLVCSAAALAVGLGSGWMLHSWWFTPKKVIEEIVH